MGALIPALVALASMFAGGSKDAPLDPTQQRLLNSTLGTQARRMTMQNPLYEAVQRLAMRLMPTAVQQPLQSFDAIDPYSGEVNLGRAAPRGTAIPTPGGTAIPTPGTPGGGGGSVPGGGGGPGPVPGRAIPRVSSGLNGIDPTTLAQLFGSR